MVRRLAVEYGKDVWCPGIVAYFSDDPIQHSSYEQADLTGFTRASGCYDADTFRQIRSHYMDEPVNLTFPVHYWTGGRPEDFPRGCQEYFLAVDAGLDLTTNHPDVMRLCESVPVYGL
jgi:hypothetical protein